ncbi:MAG TPA: hypothetical protein VFB20_08450 [Burkholderiales bacterium]|nr:hypothetical protein [Burkholderiales bacterium]
MKPWLLIPALFLAPLEALAAGQLAQVEIVDQAGGRVLPVYMADGRCYVAGRPGAEYSIRLRNRSGGDLLAVVSVDGVNVVTGETASVEQGGYILGAYASFEVKGWRKSLEHVAAFYFSRIEDSYAARTGRPENVGVIGVAVFRRRVASPPVDLDLLSKSVPEAAGHGAAEAKRATGPSSAAGATADAPLGTGHGRSETSVVRYAQFERATEQPEEVVAIYYDSYDNLVARGVIPARWHGPQPFPAGFVPDPPRG